MRKKNKRKGMKFRPVVKPPRDRKQRSLINRNRKKIMEKHEEFEKTVIRPEKIIQERRILGNFLQNGGNMTDACRREGYKNPSQKAKRLKESPSFQKLLERAGLDDKFLNKALFDDITNKPGNRLGELTLAYKLRGHMQEKKEGNKTLIMVTTGESATRYKVQSYTEEHENSG